MVQYHPRKFGREPLDRLAPDFIHFLRIVAAAAFCGLDEDLLMARTRTAKVQYQRSPIRASAEVNAPPTLPFSASRIQSPPA